MYRSVKVKLCFFFIWCSSSLCFSQEQILFDAIVSQGVTITKTKSFDESLYSNPGYYFSVGTILKIKNAERNNYYSLIAEYSHNEYKFDVFNFFEEDKIKAKYRLQYINISAQYNLVIKAKKDSLERKHNISTFYFGPYLGYLLNQKTTYNKKVQSVDKDDYNKLNYGFNIGINRSSLFMHKYLFIVGLRTSIGLKNITRNGNNTFLRSIEITVAVPLQR